jgi:hypothetical protein
MSKSGLVVAAGRIALDANSLSAAEVSPDEALSLGLAQDDEELVNSIVRRRVLVSLGELVKDLDLDLRHEFDLVVSTCETSRLMQASAGSVTEEKGAEAEEQPKAVVSKTAAALALLIEKPELSNKAIAREVGCDASLLSKPGRFKRARDAQKLERESYRNPS